MSKSNNSTQICTEPKTQLGVGAAAAPATSTIRPLVIRALIGAAAIVGLSGIGAASMLAGLDGAHASPPEASSVWLAAGSSAIPTASAAPTTLSPQQSGTAPSAQQPIDATPTAVAPCPTRTEDGKVIVNRAGLEDLRKIPGIGPKRAEAILALRTKLKRFKRSSDLLRIKGIGPKSLVRMQPHFVLDDPKGDSCAIAPSAKQ